MAMMSMNRGPMASVWQSSRPAAPAQSQASSSLPSAPTLQPPESIPSVVSRLDQTDSIKTSHKTIMYFFSLAFSIFFVVAILRLTLREQMQRTQKHVFEMISKTISVMILVSGLVMLCNFSHKPDIQTTINTWSHQNYVTHSQQPILDYIKTLPPKGKTAILTEMNYRSLDARFQRETDMLLSGTKLKDALRFSMYLILFLVLLLLVLGFIDTHPDTSEQTASATVWIEMAVPFCAFAIAYMMYANKGHVKSIVGLKDQLEESRKQIGTAFDSATEFVHAIRRSGL